MLVTALAQDPNALQRRAQLGSRFVLLRREPIRERAVRIAELEALDQLHLAQAPPVEIRERFRARLQRVVIEVDHLIEQHLIRRCRGGDRERLRLAQLRLRERFGPTCASRRG